MKLNGTVVIKARRPETEPFKAEKMPDARNTHKCLNCEKPCYECNGDCEEMKEQ